jgi:hypothetical protein
MKLEMEHPTSGCNPIEETMETNLNPEENEVMEITAEEQTQFQQLLKKFKPQ